MQPLLYSCLAAVLAAFSVTALKLFEFPFPYHASCNITWNFGKPCNVVSEALINQMNAWEGSGNCEGDNGLRCLYKFICNINDTITGIHLSPRLRYVDVLSFTFQRRLRTCTVKGSSSSTPWFALFDFGTNYCNLHNLVEGAGLHLNDQSYREKTRDMMCTQFSTAKCT